MSLRLNFEFSEAALRYIWHCAICGATEEQTLKIYRGEAVPLVQLPKGWRKYWWPNDPHYSRFCCPAHGIQLLIDGMEVWSEGGGTVVEVEVR